MFSFGNYYPTQTNKSNQVGERHQAINDIRNNPNGFQFQERTATYHCNVEITVRHNTFYANQIFHAAFAIVAPTDNGSECEEYQTGGKHIFCHCRECRTECSFSQSSAINIASPNTSNNQGQTGQSTNDDGINESTGHRNKTLFCRPFGFSRSSYDRSRTQACFIGVNTTSDTATHSKHNGCTKETTSSSSTSERTINYKFDSRNNLVREHTQNRYSSDNVKYCHERNYFTCYIRNGLQTTNDDNCNKHSKHCCNRKNI